MSSSTATAQQRHARVTAALTGASIDEAIAPTQSRKGHPLPADALEADLREAVRVRRRVRRRARAQDATTTPRQVVAPLEEDDVATTAHASQEIIARGVQILERWDGVVLEVGDKTFRARLLDEKDGRPRAEADVFVGELSPHDRPLLKPGAIFYWHIGYRDPHGDRERVSRIRFRRLPPKTKADLKRAELEADKIRSQFGWA